MGDTRGKRVLITGGTGSVGRALVEAFSSAAYQVFFSYYTRQLLADELAARFSATAFYIDLSQPLPDIRPMEVDILINNAAVNISDELTHLVSDTVWAQTLHLNLTSPFQLCRQVLPAMVERHWGRIINVSSIYGLRGVETNLAYTVSKHALSGLTKTIAKEYATHGITCNDICPGPIVSEMMDRIAVRSSASSPQSYFDEVAATIPAGRFAKPCEVASLALFLASPDAAYINGTSLTILNECRVFPRFRPALACRS